METFGASAPLQQLLHKFGVTAEHVVAAAKDQIARLRGAAVPVG
jgi:transketolase